MPNPVIIEYHDILLCCWNFSNLRKWKNYPKGQLYYTYKVPPDYFWPNFASCEAVQNLSQRYLSLGSTEVIYLTCLPRAVFLYIRCFSVYAFNMSLASQDSDFAVHLSQTFINLLTDDINSRHHDILDGIHLLVNLGVYKWDGHLSFCPLSTLGEGEPRKLEGIYVTFTSLFKYKTLQCCDKHRPSEWKI